MAGSSAQPASTPHPGCEQLLPKAFCIRHMLSKRIPFPGQGYGSLHPVTTACCFDCCCLLESPFSLCANYVKLASAFESKPKLRVSFAALSCAAGTSRLGKADALPVTARPLVIITHTLSLPSQLCLSCSFSLIILHPLTHQGMCPACCPQSCLFPTPSLVPPSPYNWQTPHISQTQGSPFPGIHASEVCIEGS